jgi:putative ATP-dependent endonuclease of OLD family
VEGETEFWMMGELARLCGYDLASEGVTCVEFAQCGLAAVIKVAQHLGIEWHLLADGDAAGQQYARAAREFGRGSAGRVTVLREPDIEHCFWSHGYEDVFRNIAFPRGSSVNASVQKKAPAKSVIRRAIERHSKPHLAVLLLDAAMDRGAGGIPRRLREAIETCVRLARHGGSTTAARARA